MLESEQRRVNWLRKSFASMTIQWPRPKDSRGRLLPTPRWNAYTLIPQPDVFGIDAEFYSIKMMIYQVCNKDPMRYRELYENTRESDVWELYGLYLADIYPTYQ